VVKISTGYNVLVVHPSVPAKSVSELIAFLKGEPGKYNFASGGVGNPAHLLGEMFLLRTGTRATHVPYPQGQQFTADLLSGATQFSFISSVRVVDLVATGKLRALAVMGPERIAALKDVPTIVEAGFPDLAAEDWAGFATKAGTSNQIVVRLNDAINRALAKEDVREAFMKVGHRTVGGTPAEFGTLINSEIARWGKVIQDAVIKAD
jgi:tripartite-type tricarboxylate transporter receptor subunit TctC